MITGIFLETGATVLTFVRVRVSRYAEV
jgi:hypothetical protein